MGTFGEIEICETLNSKHLLWPCCQLGKRPYSNATVIASMCVVYALHAYGCIVGVYVRQVAGTPVPFH